MPFDVLPWHWVVFGALICISELFLVSFFVLWFGVAAIVTGILLWIVPMSFTIQITIWAILSALMAFAWFKFLKPLNPDRTLAGLSREAIVNEIGQVIVAPAEDKRGRLRFPAPVLGNDEWMIIATEPLAVGDRVRVKDVSGNALVVEKVS